ncbi:Panacea domain-containing protein [Lichenibacterium ramalinae]|uniref:DUF4065 domain-containing protein n=1 Tax=Lichenibacterium ramalinae TaxID=2316527 RepID=A0A4Q2RH50_9HYPH|nr:type II toxin-antitoxin system antitoxin SocA domain-containing protein [Lichenibacterium ramalinae]RYB07565.1 DUF4065 domain-containing protein [Lichenibacterium ramalinae]
MTTAQDGRAVANFILDYCDGRGRKVTNLSLQKIIYFCHVWSLIELNGPLVRHKFEAWEFGPVLPYLYRAFRNYDRAPILGRATYIDPVDGVQRVAEYEFNFEIESLLRETVEFYSRLRAGDLVELSHVEGGPWHSVWNHMGNVNPGMMIDDTRILKFYSKVRAPFAIQ